MKKLFLFVFFIALFSGDLIGQLEWILEPVVEYENFTYKPEHSKEVLTIKGKNRQYGIQLKNGKYLYKVGTIKKAEFIYGTGSFFCISSTGDTIIINSKGKVISNDYQKIDFKYHTNLFIVEKDGVMGIIDTSGIEVVDLKYKSIQKKKKGNYIGKLPDGTIENIKLHETNEKFVSKIFENKARALNRKVVRKKTDIPRGFYITYGLINMEGDTIIKLDQYKFHSNSIDVNSKTIVTFDIKTKKYGIMDADGAIVLPFEYDKINPKTMKFGYVICKKGDTYYNYKLDGSLNSSFTGSEIIKYKNQPYFYFKKGKHFYIIDSLFNNVIPFGVDRIINPDKSLSFSSFNLNKKFGFYSFKSGFVTEPQFKNLSYLANGNVSVKENEKFAFYNPHNGKIIYKQNHFLQRGSYYYVENKVKGERFKYTYSFYDENFNLIFGPVENIVHFLEGDFILENFSKKTKKIHNLATGKSIETNNKVYYKYNDILQLGYEQYCFLSHCMDPDREIFTSIKYKENGIYIVQKNGKYGIYKDGKQIEPPRFNDLKYNYETFIVKLNGKWGILDNPYSR